MNLLIRLESVALFIVSLFLFNALHMSWWLYAACILLPDLGMLGYLLNAKIGAYAYNFFHHLATGMVIYFLGVSLDQPMMMFAGVILFSHTTLDRIFGYGLKYEKGFKFTHLGEVGR